MGKSLKTFLIIFAKLLYGIFCLVSTLLISLYIFIILAHSIISVENFDSQIIFFTFLSMLLIISLWLLPFTKTNLLIKCLILLVMLCIQLRYIEISLLFPSVKKALDMDFCIDTGICVEGLKTKIDGYLVVINKDNCIKYGHIWIEKNRSCDMNKKY